MPRRLDYALRPMHEVFKQIDMRGGDPNQCWPWKGYMDQSPVFCWDGKRYRAHRVVYSLRYGIYIKNVPQLTWKCGNNMCCNPEHLVPRFSMEERLIGNNGWRSRPKVACYSADDVAIYQE